MATAPCLIALAPGPPLGAHRSCAPAGQGCAYQDMAEAQKGREWEGMTRGSSGSMSHVGKHPCEVKGQLRLQAMFCMPAGILVTLSLPIETH